MSLVIVFLFYGPKIRSRRNRRRRTLEHLAQHLYMDVGYYMEHDILRPYDVSVQAIKNDPASYPREDLQILVMLPQDAMTPEIDAYGAERRLQEKFPELRGLHINFAIMAANFSDQILIR